MKNAEQVNHEDRERVMTALWALINKCGSQAAAAKEIGISQQYLSDTLSEAREIPDRVLDFLGYRREIRYIEKKASAQ